MPAYSKIRGFFSVRLNSMTAAVFLLIFLGAISLLGTFPTEFIPAKSPGAWFANGIIRATQFAGGRALYGSAIFLGFLAILGVFLAEVIIRQSKFYFSKKENLIAPCVENSTPLRVKSAVSLEEAHRRILDTAKAMGFRAVFPSSEKETARPAFQIIKNQFGFWGPIGAHVGMLVVLLAGLMTFLSAEVREVEIREGEALTLAREQTKLTLDKFLTLRYPGKDQVQQYISHFHFEKKSGEREFLDLSVNHPLHIGGTKIFQMRYRVDVPAAEVTVYKEGQPYEVVRVNGRAPTVAPKSGLVLRYENVVPDFRIGKGGEVFSIGSSFNNPAVKLFIKDRDKEESRWIFRDLLPGHKGVKKSWDFNIRKLYKVFYSGVRLSNDPGIPYAFLGYVILVFSVFLSSFAVPRLIRVNLEKGENGGTRVLLEGLSSRDLPGLEEEMTRLAEGIKKKGGGLA